MYIHMDFAIMDNVALILVENNHGSSFGAQNHVNQ